MRRLISLLIAVAIVGVPLTFVISLVQTKDLIESIRYSISAVVIWLIITIFLGLLEYLGKNIVQEIADGIVDWVDHLLASHRKNYLEYLVYRHRFFDTKGLTVQGEYNLELEQVYVELTLMDPSNSSEEEAGTIWAHLANDCGGDKGCRYVILGLPGSGKTTLLRHMVLTLANSGKQVSNNKQLKKLPILITLRDHAPQIQKTFDLSLPEAILITLAGKAKEVPADWFHNQLKKGRCIILMDGLDEIADESARLGIVNWVENQFAAYPKNDFILASRPHGYQRNIISGVKRLEIKPFTNKQVRKFIQNWYLANEIRASQKDDLGVRMVAEENAEKLIKRVQDKTELAALAVNPLLVTMIATVHNFKAVLPGRRVELYDDIFDVFLQRRRHLIWSSSHLSKSQKMEVLRVLAHHMMTKELRTISINEASSVISNELTSVGSNLSGEDFLRNIEYQSGLILDVGDNQFRFAHLTYQEYLTAKYIFDHKNSLEAVLIESLDGGWWDETVRLYVALTDATNVIQACLEKYPDIHAYSLALDCLTEALKVDPEIRLNVEQTLVKNMNSDQIELRSLTAEAMLTSRVVFMTRISENLRIDRKLVSNVEYQLFLNDMEKEGSYFFPDHWKKDRFPDDHGALPVVGIRYQDAVRFCQWLTEREKGSAKYRIPSFKEADTTPVEKDEDIGYWINENNTISFYPPQVIQTQFSIRQQTVIRQIEDDIFELRLLNEALNFPPAKPTKDLEVRVPFPGSGGTLSGEARAGAGLAIEYQLRRRQEIVSNLKRKKNIADKLELDFERLIRASAKVFLKDIGDVQKATNWLSPKDTYYFSHLDLEEDLGSSCEYFQKLSSQDFDGDLLYFVDNMPRALYLLLMREWANPEYSTANDFAETSKFLRWFVRLCGFYLGASEKQKIFTYPNKNNMQWGIADMSENLVVGMAFLEKRFEGSRKQIESLRLVKIVS